MNADHWHQVTAIFHGALMREAQERAAFVDAACEHDATLRDDVEKLLEAHVAAAGFGEELVCAQPPDEIEVEPGTLMGPYVVEALIGSGGMGVVYRARDPRLERPVAIKILREGIMADPSRRRGLIHEARAASALNHPNIITIYDIARASGRDYIAMEYVEGMPLHEVITTGGLAVERAIDLAVQIARALAAAHAAGLIHRDLKPANLLVTADGYIKIIDFGLSKLTRRLAPVDSSELSTVSLGDRVIEGTPGYAAPEQVRGEETDARTDVFAVGAILYELLTGRRAFDGHSSASRLIAAVHVTPPALRTIRRDIPRNLQRLVARAIEKRPEARYPSAAELLSDLRAMQERHAVGRLRVREMLRRPVMAAAVGGLLAVIASVAGWFWWHQSSVRWVRYVALPEAARLIDDNRNVAAMRVLRQTERYVAGDPVLRELIDRASTLASVTTQPEGVEVMVRDLYGDPDEWESLGRTPIHHARLPAGINVWRLALAGYHTLEIIRRTEAAQFRLFPVPEAPAGMVFVAAPPAGSYLLNLPGVQLQDFWLDTYEVSNRQFMAFIDAGGYESPAHWPATFNRDGAPVSWQQAKLMFVDRTGRPGPSDWQLGTFPEGQEDYPVGGVSWYEAVSYCAAVGKQLPSIYHWYEGAGFGPADEVLTWEGNFSGVGAQPNGGRRRFGRWGAYDMAGNVKEWVWNQAKTNRRYLLGGGWSEPSYMFASPDAQPPLDRQSTYGFRCVKYSAPPAPEVLAFVESPARDYRVARPLPDEAFAAVAEMYRYHGRPLRERIERVDDGAMRWRIEEVSIAAAYGAERVSALLFLPRNASPPYQTVIWFPVGEPLRRKMVMADAPSQRVWFEFLIRSGRAVVLPAVKGSFERHLGGKPRDMWGELMVAGSQDIGRVIDYLETRADIDATKIAYAGISLGAGAGPIMTAMEPRFKASLLIGGGLPPHQPPAYADALNFLPRVKTPTLMLAGKHDFIFPYETSQQPMFDLLATPKEHKRHKAFETGHMPLEQVQVHKEALGWLDRYLGPVSTR